MNSEFDASPDEADPFCFICKCAIPKPTEDHYCFGCNQFICPDHLNDPMGSHEPEEHDDAY